MIRREVALKIIRPDLCDNERVVNVFLREAEACIWLDHPNIVTVYDLGKHGRLVYITMSLVDGEDLSKRVESTGVLHYSEALMVIMQCASALSCMSSHKIVHRDIKPSNIMLTNTGCIKVLDMGLARLHGRDRVAPAHIEPGSEQNCVADKMEMLGTFAYMSPEQASDPDTVDIRSDIYSLGCTLYYLLSGSHAFDANSPKACLAMHRDPKRPSLITSRADCPEEVERLFQRMIALRPEDRFQSAQQLEFALSNLPLLQSGLIRERLHTAPMAYRETRRDTTEDLKNICVGLSLVTEKAWKRAELAVHRSLHSHPAELQARRFAHGVTGLFAPMGPATWILYRLRQLQLTVFQEHQILAGYASRLRLPEHVILDKIGLGWKGEIFLGRHVKTNRLEVLRTFNPDGLTGITGGESTKLLTFLELIRHIGSIKHRALPRYLSSGHQGAVAYVAEERILGLRLKEFLRQQSDAKRGFSWAVDASIDLVQVLEIAHSHGILHLDLDKQALLVDRRQQVRLLGLGLAKCVLTDSKGAVFYGSPHVMPPEQWILPTAVSTATDVYNLGCTLFLMFTGRYPYDANDLDGLRFLHLYGNPLECAEAEHLHPILGGLLTQMLAKNPAERPTMQYVRGQLLEVRNALD